MKKGKIRKTVSKKKKRKRRKKKNLKKISFSDRNYHQFRKEFRIRLKVRLNHQMPKSHFLQKI